MTNPPNKVPAGFGAGSVTTGLRPDRHRIVRVSTEIVLIVILTIVGGLTINGRTGALILGVCAALGVVVVELSVISRRLPDRGVVEGGTERPRPKRRKGLELVMRGALFAATFAFLGLSLATNSTPWLIVAFGAGALGLVPRLLRGRPSIRRKP